MEGYASAGADVLLHLNATKEKCDRVKDFLPVLKSSNNLVPRLSLSFPFLSSRKTTREEKDRERLGTRLEF